MSVEYFVASKEVQDLALKLIGKQHPDLAGSLNKGELVVVFREKASKSGGQVILGSSKRAQPIINALAGENYVFIIELAQDQWTKLDTKQQEACLDHFLCACRADHDEKTGNTKYVVVKPEVQAFRENVERYGMWFPKDEEDDEEGGTNPVDDMFGQGEKA
jgi:hypothetical protein